MPGQNLVFATYDVSASPADDAETVIAVLNGVSTIYDGQPVYLHLHIAISPDADATQVEVKIKRESIDGDDVGESIFCAIALDADGVATNTQGDTYVIDEPGNAQNATYVGTVEVHDATDESPVAQVYLEARVG